MIHSTPLPEGFSPNEMLTGEHHCPTCGQQTYLRPVDLSSPLVHALRIIAGRSASGSITTGNDMARYGRTIYCNYTQLKYWNFIFEDRSAGGWRITPFGQEFISSPETRVARRLWVFNDEVRRVDGFQFDMRDTISASDIKPYAPKNRQEVREQLIALEHEGE